MVGNIAHVVSGTNFTAGFYMITSVSVGVSVTCDANVSTGGGAGSAGVINIGGAIKSIGKLGSATANLGATPGNRVWVKADNPYSQGANDSWSVAGSFTSPVMIEGYKTTRGDGWVGRNASGDGTIITTNMPNYQYQAGFRFTAGGGSPNAVVLKNINFSVAGAGFTGSLIAIPSNSYIIQCVATNPSTNVGAAGISSSGTTGKCSIINCDVNLTGSVSSATGQGIFIGGTTYGRVLFNRIFCGAISGGVGINVGASFSYVMKNTVIGSGGNFGIAITNVLTVSVIDSNTVVGFGDDLNIITGNTGEQLISNNNFTDSTTNAINLVDTSNVALLYYNRLRDATTINSGNANYLSQASGQTTTGSGSSSDYVNFAGGDLRLVSTSPAVGAAVLAPSSTGSLQRSQTGTTSVEPANSYVK
jgi:hypothetical protein